MRKPRSKWSGWEQWRWWSRKDFMDFDESDHLNPTIMLFQLGDVRHDNDYDDNGDIDQRWRWLYKASVRCCKVLIGIAQCLSTGYSCYYKSWGFFSHCQWLFSIKLWLWWWWWWWWERIKQGPLIIMFIIIIMMVGLMNMMNIMIMMIMMNDYFDDYDDGRPVWQANRRQKPGVKQKPVLFI